MRTAITATALALALLAVQALATDPAGPRLERQFNETVRPFLQTYCADCHNAEKHKGDLDLTGPDLQSGIRELGRAPGNRFREAQVELAQVTVRVKRCRHPVPLGVDRYVRRRRTPKAAPGEEPWKMVAR